MRFSFAVLALSAILSPTLSSDAFTPSRLTAFLPRGGQTHGTARASTASSAIVEVETQPIPGMKPGTSGLRKKVEVWQGKEGDKYYVENFIQSLLDTATAKNGGDVPQT